MSESEVIIEGYLFKKSIKNIFQLWRKKYFVLFSNKLIYCDTDTDVTTKELTKNLELNKNFSVKKGNENYELIICNAISNNNQDSGSNNEVGIRLKALNEDEINKWTLKLNYVINNLKINISDCKRENNQEISKSSIKTLKESLSEKIKKINYSKTIEIIDQFQDSEKTNKLSLSDSHRMLSYDRLIIKNKLGSISTNTSRSLDLMIDPEVSTYNTDKDFKLDSFLKQNSVSMKALGNNINQSVRSSETEMLRQKLYSAAYSLFGADMSNLFKEMKKDSRRLAHISELHYTIENLLPDLNSSEIELLAKEIYINKFQKFGEAEFIKFMTNNNTYSPINISCSIEMKDPSLDEYLELNKSILKLEKRIEDKKGRLNIITKNMERKINSIDSPTSRFNQNKKYGIHRQSWKPGSSVPRVFEYSEPALNKPKSEIVTEKKPDTLRARSSSPRRASMQACLGPKLYVKSTPRIESLLIKKDTSSPKKFYPKLFVSLTKNDIELNANKIIAYFNSVYNNRNFNEDKLYDSCRTPVNNYNRSLSPRFRKTA